MFQTMDKITHDHKVEKNDQIKYELIILQKQFLQYNKETFDQFM